MDQRTARLVAVAMLGFLLFSPPLLGVFDTGAMVLGVPLLWVYLMVAWAAVIGLIAAAARKAG